MFFDNKKKVVVCRKQLTSTVIDNFSPNGVTRKHLQITNNKEMPAQDKQQSELLTVKYVNYKCIKYMYVHGICPDTGQVGCCFP